MHLVTFEKLSSCCSCSTPCPLKGQGWYFGFFLMLLQFRKGWKILCQKSLKDFLSALGNFPSSALHCLVKTSVSLGTQCTWEARHVLILLVNHRGCWCGLSFLGQQQWSKLVFNRRDASVRATVLMGPSLNGKKHKLLAFNFFFKRI